MNNGNNKIGIDIGAVFLKVVVVDESGNVIDSFYKRHKGNFIPVFKEAMEIIDCNSESTVGITGSAAEIITSVIGIDKINQTKCQIEYIKEKLPETINLIDIGGASATLIQLDGKGNFQGYSTNSMCAAGTGSFLDEQSDRLSISYHDAEAFNYIESPPTIATRCSVFAKSDLIHRQQEGFGKDAMWSGLCRGMTRTLVSTLLSGRPINKPTAIVGGVAQNMEVIRWLKHSYGDLINVPDLPHFSGAIGASVLGTDSVESLKKIYDIRFSEGKDITFYNWPLKLEKTVYPSFDSEESYVDDNKNEVRVLAWPEKEKDVEGYLGIDIGSTSTKLALINNDKEVIVDIYRKTGGDPINATRLLFNALGKLAGDKGSELKILGVGTTGSGRKIIGSIIGADAIINEISAHVAGAVETDPTVDTIFEIGGQDSKYMHVVDGHVRDSNMNYVCAAGTGSFVEEQAGKLGYDVADVGKAILGITPPMASDRCTVFMEQDVTKLIQNGASPEEALSAVMVSVIQNYISKVVGNRYYNRKKIFFQGATARNQALVAAFERKLGVEVVVSPYCHVMGAFGVALLTRELFAEDRKKESKFIGLSLPEVNLRKEICTLCHNDCSITFAEIEGVEEASSWGYMCGREPDEQKMRANPHERLFRIRQRLWRDSGKGTKLPENNPVIGIPQALSTYTYLPLWMKFFNELGFNVQLSGASTDEIRESSTTISGADFCFPAKIVIGHMAKLALEEGVDFIFLPQMINDTPKEHVTASTFCPYVQGAPASSKAALEVNGIDTSRIIAPPIDMQFDNKVIVKVLHKYLGKSLEVNRNSVAAAWEKGLEAQDSFNQKLIIEGEKVLKEADENGEKLIILLGRPYNIYDKGINLGLPQKIAEQGYTVLPLDFLNPDLKKLKDIYKNVYWNYGQKILGVLEEIAEEHKHSAIFLSNFSCGPDSFILTYAEEIMGNQPFLALELDEHGADAGYMTRIEAFFDVVKKPKSETEPRYNFSPEPIDFKDKVIWLPPMHEFGGTIFTAIFKKHGYEARLLPDEDREAHEIGKAVTRGFECLPTSLTIGTFIKNMRNGKGTGRDAIFMPTAQGPCRFGQYSTLYRQVLDREGYEDVVIMSPSSYTGYQGFDEELRKSLFKGMLASDILLKIRNKVRPYEKEKGITDKVIKEELERIAYEIEHDVDFAIALKPVAERLMPLKQDMPKKPLVGIVGELYVRNNIYSNEDVIRSIESFGGEAWMTPSSEWMLFVSSPENMRNMGHKPYALSTLKSRLKYKWMVHWEKKMYKVAGSFLNDRHEPPFKNIMTNSKKYIPVNIGGEANLTIGRAIEFARGGASLIVNCSPFGCMPGTVTTALFRPIANELETPIVNLFYDGSGHQNSKLEVFLSNAMASE